MSVLSGKTAHTIEIVVVVLNALGNLAAALAGSLSPQWASIDSAVGVAALALARGLSNIGTPPSAPPVSSAGAGK